MSFDGGYPAPQRPYNGQAVQRPPPQRQFPPGPGASGPGPNGGPQQYEPYQENFGRGGGGGSYEYNGAYEDQGYGYGGPQQGGYPGPSRGGLPPMSGGRGGPPQRQMPMDGSGRGAYPPRGGAAAPGGPMRGGGYVNGSPGRQAGSPGRQAGPPGRQNSQSSVDSFGAAGRGRGGPQPLSPIEAGFGGNPFPPFPGQQGKVDRFDDQSFLDDMAALELSESQSRQQQTGGRPPNGQGPAPMRGPMGPPGGGGGNGGGYGPPRGLQRAFTEQVNFGDARRGPSQGYGPPQGDYLDNFGPPGRTMTMSSVDDSRYQALPPRGDAGPYDRSGSSMSGNYGGGMGGNMGSNMGGNMGGGMRGGMRGGMGGAMGGGRGMGPGMGPSMGPGMGQPLRPSTAQGSRPPPQRMYPGGGDDGGYDNGAPGPGQAYGQPPQQQQQQQSTLSFDELYDTYYYYWPRNNDEYGAPGGAEAMHDFDPNLQQDARNSRDQQMFQGNGGGMEPAQAQPQQGATRYPELSKTKSQPNLRQPQTAVFEMAGDIPPMPTNMGGFQQGPPGPPGPPGPHAPGAGLPSGPAPARQGSGASARSNQNPDMLPSHPTPVRPGLMANSVASHMSNMGSKPAPVRNYAGTVGMQPGPSPTPGPGAAGAPGQAPGQGPGKAAEVLPPVTPELLEQLRTKVKANPNDQATALLLAKRLMEAVDVLVPKLPDPRARNKARERYTTDAHKTLKKLAGAQNGEAMFFMADCLGRGVFGGEPDNKEAFTLYQSAAKLGHAAAAYRTAVCCEIGNEEGGGTRKDPLKAIQWYKRAATLGDTPAMYKVGMILLKGLLGQQRNAREAVSWLRRAADQADTENPHALHELGLLYESAEPNDSIVRDETYAFQLFQQAAELGYKFSQFRLGCAYEYGLMGCPIDGRLSIMWYSRAATQEEHQSELALSGWYLTGNEGVLQQSDTEAYLWARKAAAAGLAKGEYAMGYFTETGIGVPANLEDAKRWYWRAAAQDFPKARERLEDLKRGGRTGPRQRERISRSKQQEGDCAVM